MSVLRHEQSQTRGLSIKRQELERNLRHAVCGCCDTETAPLPLTLSVTVDAPNTRGYVS
jgi:hypothetical protein